MECQRNNEKSLLLHHHYSVVTAFLLLLTLFTSSHASGFHDHTFNINQHHLQHNQTHNGETTAKPGYFKPLQVVKVVSSQQQSLTPTLDVAESLPKAEAWKAAPLHDVSKTAYGLPGYSGPEGFSPRRGATAADYSANVAGFIPEGASSDKKSQSFMSQFEPPPTEGNYRSASLKAVNPDQFTRRYKERREPYSPFASASNEDSVSQYLKTADPHNNGHSSSSYSNSDGGYGSRTIDSFGSSTRKKISFEDGVGPDGHPPQPFGSSDFHQSDLGSGSSLYSSPSQSHSMEHSVSASNDNELAQLAASMSDFSASPASSSPDFSSMNTGDQMSLADASGFGSFSSTGSTFGPSLSGFGSPSLMSGNPAFAASIPSPASVPGVPAGAIVGAPGSAPPPGMKLAGYVTMAAPANPMPMGGMPGMRSMINPMMAASMMPGNPMMSSMSSMRPFPMMGPSGMMSPMPSMMNPMMGPMGMSGFGGPMGPGMMPPAMQSMFGGAMPGMMGNSNSGNTGTKSSANSNGSSSSSSSSGNGSQTSASNPTPARSRFLARLNPMNLFRRLRSRVSGGPSSTPKPTSASSFVSEEAKALESMLASESNPIPVKKGFSFLSRRSDNYLTNSSQDRLAAENFQHPFHTSFHRHTPFTIQPLFRFETPMNSFPRRRGRRIHESAPKFFDSDVASPSQGLMGSGNFEVIRGGLLPTASSISGQESVHHEDFGSSRPPVLGFQGFNHFSSSTPSGSIYNTLTSDSSNAFAIESLPQPVALKSSESQINAIVIPSQTQQKQQQPLTPKTNP